MLLRISDYERKKCKNYKLKEKYYKKIFKCFAFLPSVMTNGEIIWREAFYKIPEYSYDGDDSFRVTSILKIRIITFNEYKEINKWQFKDYVIQD